MTKRAVGLCLWGLVVGGLLILAVPRVQAVDGRPVVSVLTVKLKGDEQSYLDKVRKLTALSERLQTGGRVRVWRATFSGDSTGLILVATEYPSLEALARGATKLQADQEWKKLIKEVEKSGVREIVGRSLFEEITP